MKKNRKGKWKETERKTEGKGKKGETGKEWK